MINKTTAKEFDAESIMIPYHLYDNEDKDLIKSAMIEFAQIHVERALKEVTEKLYFRDSNGNCIRSEESNKLVLNIYPLSLIK